MTTNEKIGEIIRTARQSNKLTMLELGAKLGVAESTMWHYEKGTRGLTIDQFFKLCDILGLSPNEIMKQVSA